MSPKNSLRSKLDGDEIDMSMMRLTEIPVDDLAAVSKGTKIDLSNNELTFVPQNFSKSLPHVIKLVLGSNKIRELPLNFGNLPKLKFLDLYNNQLIDLPLSLANLTNLKYLDLKGNPLKPELAKVVGTCLNIKECQEAAKNLLAYLRKIKDEKERQNQVIARREKDLELAKLKKEEEDLTKRRAEKKASKEKRRQDMQKHKQAEPKIKLNGIENNKPQTQKVDKKRLKKVSKPILNKSKRWFSTSIFNIGLLVATAFAVSTCLMLHSEGDLSINGFQMIAWPKIQLNSMKIYNSTRDSFTKENIKYNSIKFWNVLQPILFHIKEAVVIFLIATKEVSISFYEMLRTGDLNVYVDGVKSTWNFCIKFFIRSIVLMQKTLQQVDWQALLDGFRRSCEYILESLISAKDYLQNNDTLRSYWKDTETFRSNCWNYTIVTKDAVVKLSNDVYVNYYPIVKERASSFLQSIQAYITIFAR